MATELHHIRNNPLLSCNNNCPSLDRMHAVHSSSDRETVHGKTE